MSAESPKVDSAPEPEVNSWEYCVLQWNPEAPIDMKYYGVNVRDKMHGDDDIQREIRKTREKEEPDLHPLNAYYHKKFIERWREVGGFGPSDAINILAEDNWEIVTSSGFHGYITDNSKIYTVFKRPKSPETSDQTSE